LFRCPAEAAVQSRREPTARKAGDLGIDVSKLALSSANRCIRSYFCLAQSRHLLRLFVLDSAAIPRDCVAVAAVCIGSVLAQPGQRFRQLTPSLLEYRSLFSHGFPQALRLVGQLLFCGDRRKESSGSCNFGLLSYRNES
jgi:hypothetical protein